MLILRIDKENGEVTKIPLKEAVIRISNQYGNYPNLKTHFRRLLLKGGTVETNFAIYKIENL